MKKLIYMVVFFVIMGFSAKNSFSVMSSMNKLKDEKSPYLLQHADNPVDWYPWGEEAFEKARKEDKPVLLSIGYSTCHWCHVMEHESFEDDEVAKLMNETFVSIKVDREERPDIDNIYMTVCQILSQGNCGWPLNIVMTPEKKPFFAATYIPKQSRFGRLGMIELIPKIKETWEKKRAEINESAESIIQTLKVATDPANDMMTEDLNLTTLERSYEQLSKTFDNTNGGFGSRPKFPTTHKLLFLLRYYNRTGEENALNIVTKTLDEMSLGGIYDHIGFGFHRYSTDSEWLLPHFEKMLYDQALIAMAYTEAFQVTKKTEYEKTAREIFTYILRDMTSPEGGFYSAEDADSEGEEGKFYVWTRKEIVEILGQTEANLIMDIYNIHENGNFREESTGEPTGTNIFHLKKPLSEIAKKLDITEKELLEKLEASRKKLFEQREKRIHPSKDDKILTDWNSLMITALSKAGRVFKEKKYVDMASEAADFINTKLTEKGKLLHRYRNGEAAIQANLDDYAFFILGLLELYEASFDIKYLKKAISLSNDMIKNFWDENKGGFFFTSDNSETILVRQKEIYDGALPSGNSVAMYDLLKLARITANTKYEQKAMELANAFSSSLNKIPMSHTMFMVSLDFAIGPSYEVVIAGEKSSTDTDMLIHALNEKYIPNKVVLLKEENDVEIIDIAPYTKAQKRIKDKATAYVCLDHVCKLPTNSPEKMLELISEKPK